MRVNVQLFARAREIYGQQAITLELPAGSTPADCMELLVAETPALETMRASLLVALNQSYSDWSAALADGDELAFIPPVSGG